MSLYLLVLDNEEITQSLKIEKERLEIGRAENADIRFDLPEVSRNHARLILNPKALNGDSSLSYVAELTDTGSRYGVWVGDEQVWYCQLDAGQFFKVSDRLSLCLSFDSREVLLEPRNDLLTSSQTEVEPEVSEVVAKPEAAAEPEPEVHEATAPESEVHEAEPEPEVHEAEPEPEVHEAEPRRR